MNIHHWGPYMSLHKLLPNYFLFSIDQLEMRLIFFCFVYYIVTNEFNLHEIQINDPFFCIEKKRSIVLYLSRGKNFNICFVINILNMNIFQISYLISHDYFRLFPTKNNFLIFSIFSFFNGKNLFYRHQEYCLSQKIIYLQLIIRKETVAKYTD